MTTEFGQAPYRPEREEFHKEIDLIQGIITRMAANSFQVKAWMIGILSALVVFESDAIFAGANGNKLLAIQMNLFLLLPVFSFWYLDAFFLSTEKLYRELYKWVVKNRPHTNAYLYDLNTFQRKIGEQKVNLIKPANSVWNVMLSKTLLPFYFIPLAFVVGLLFFNIYR